MKIKSLLLSSLLIITVQGFSQKNEPSAISDTIFQQKNKVIIIKLNENKIIEDSSIIIKEATKSLTFEYKITLNKGALKIETYTPDGKKEEKDMIIDTQYSFGEKDKPKAKITTGNFAKVIRNPQEGKWKVRIVPQKAEGSITINYYIN